MNKLALFSFIKDEQDILESFIDHHLKIFDEITIIDNGSTDNTLDILKKYAGDITILHDHSDFKHKGDICSNIMKQSKCDLLVPMDADEIMVYDTVYHKKTVSKLFSKIRTYLQNIEITGKKYQINRVYDYIPSKQNYYCCSISNNKKIIFPRTTFMYTDCGFHRGRVSLDNCESFSDEFYWRHNRKNDAITKLHNISYLHFHFRDTNFWKKNTEKKLRARLGDDWNNLDVLKKYNGRSKHLVSQYIAYLESGSVDSMLSPDVYFEITN